MAPLHAYVPSRALLRALSRPQTTRCPFAQPLTTPFLRGKRTRAAKMEKPDAPTSPKGITQLHKEAARLMKELEDPNYKSPPLTDEQMAKLPPIRWYERDLDTGRERLISEIVTVEDRKRSKEMEEMIEESGTNPDYDDAELNRRLMDSLISNPNFADMTDALEEIKSSIRSKEELEELDKQHEKAMEHAGERFEADLWTTTREALQELIDDPDAQEAKDDLQAVVDRMAEKKDTDDPEFQAILGTALTKLNDSPAFQKKMAAMDIEEKYAESEKEWADFESRIDDAIEEVDAIVTDRDCEAIEDESDLDKILEEIRDIVKVIGGNVQLKAQLDATLGVEPTAEDEVALDPEELVEELRKEVETKGATSIDLDSEEDVPAELQAKVDAIMQDPKLVEKVVYIRKLIAEQSLAPSNITSIAHEVAPDPSTLEPTRTAPVSQRIQTAISDPAHTAALSRLRVSLSPSFNISPALKSFNQAIELAYVGANDDIRRILWRSYQKARTLPTFLQGVSDEAWDILWYSQAVTWGSNQNRRHHLKVLLRDLKSLGRDGPPTHPSNLVKGGEGKVLDA
ncbi:hypothetical protein CC86DRAFT_82497 [Ophiobolus disseminans]|uniref:Uncharacterized protein n=1 Tax=Ophiobolus disseminans TaxID=1469910 RepID=A0A6A7AG41_9PLEO|nr:hypothetical protein CC86DRAFT_82497 [Ophiobolus disseminans]